LIIQRKKATPEDIYKWLATLPGFIEGLTSTRGRPTRLYDYQARIIADRHPFICIEKARQIGWSWCRALRALAQCHLVDDMPHLIISLNLLECRKKIRFARRAWETLPASIRLPVVVDNKLELEFSNGSRIMAIFDPRGEGGADVDLDELAHYSWDRQVNVYTDSLPVVSRGGHLAIGSTPLGKAGRFYEIAHEVDGKYANYHHYRIYWWDCPDLCRDVGKAREDAGRLPTEERVGVFGSTRLKEIFDSLPLEDFQQEYELLYVDERTSFFPYELILSATEPQPEVYSTFTELKNKATGTLYAGFDVGRHRNTSELTVFERLGEVSYERLFKTYDKVEFQAQEADLGDCLTILGPKLARLSIDQNGIGMMLAENLVSRFGSRVEPVTITNQVKERMAIEFRVGLEKRAIRLYPDRERIRHLHSVKKTLLPGGSTRYDTVRNEKHHADKAWSQMLAYWGAASEAPRIDMSLFGCVGRRSVLAELDGWV
jgi:phage FluMu gp28-like protein